MVEVFKTDVCEVQHAVVLVNRIHQEQATYAANFDLLDCDNILRVRCDTGAVCPDLVIGILRDAGFYAEVLPDEVAVVHNLETR